jgi:hypothetical protein
MYNDNNTAAQSRDLILAGGEPIESIEDLLRKCGFFDAIVCGEKDEEVFAS